MTRRTAVGLTAATAGMAQTFTGLDATATTTGTGTFTVKRPLLGAGEVAHVVCDKCGGDDIEYRDANPPKAKDVKLSEWVNQPMITSVQAVARYRQYVAECRSCHFRVEYMRPW